MSVTDNTGTHETSASRTATIWPISLAVGVAVLLVGLIVNPEVIAPLGGAITVVAAAAWIRGGRQGEQPSTRKLSGTASATPAIASSSARRSVSAASLPAPLRYPPSGWLSCPPSSVSGGARSTLDR